MKRSWNLLDNNEITLVIYILTNHINKLKVSIWNVMSKNKEIQNFKSGSKYRTKIFS